MDSVSIERSWRRAACTGAGAGARAAAAARGFSAAPGLSAAFDLEDALVTATLPDFALAGLACLAALAGASATLVSKTASAIFVFIIVSSLVKMGDAAR